MIRRNPSTTTRGQYFDDPTIAAVWEKGRVVRGHDPNVWRQDACGAWIKNSAYGDTNSQFGWEIDHITPVAHRGSDALSNLQPLQWENNRAKSDGALVCAVAADR